MARKAKAQPAGDTAAHIVVVLDRSGSMGSIRMPTIEGFNDFLAEQRKLPGARFSMTQFDTEGIDQLYADVPVDAVERLTEKTYVPRSGTPLYDAVGRAIATTDILAPTGKVVFVVITDGYENSSREYSQKAILDLVTARRAAGWEFVFMGADIDAYAVGASIGVAMASSYNYAGTASGTQTAWQNLSSSTSSYRSGQTQTVDMSNAGTAPTGAASTTTTAAKPLAVHRVTTK